MQRLPENERFIEQHHPRTLPRVYVLDSSGRNIALSLGVPLPPRTMRAYLGDEKNSDQRRTLADRLARIDGSDR